MVVCSCRDIRDSQYITKEELIARLLQDDYCCGTCLDEFLPNDNKDLRKRKSGTYGKYWIHHLELKVNRYHAGDDIPDGWVRGRKLNLG